MATRTLPSRDEISPEYKWALDEVYPRSESWDEDFASIEPMLQELAALKGRLAESRETLLAGLQLRDRINERMERLFNFARMKRDEDNTVARYQALDDRARVLWTHVQETASFYSPEILAAGKEKIDSFLVGTPGLDLYAHLLEDLFRQRDHMLSEHGEALLAAAGDMAAGAGQIYDMLTQADMTFGTIDDEEGNEVDLSYGRYYRYMMSPDRRVRADTFSTFLGAYSDHRNALATCYATEVKKDIFYARSRKYDTSLESALAPDNIPVAVYTNLIEAVRANLPLLHRYMDLRRRALKVDQLHMYDLLVPLVPQFKNVIEYPRAVETVTDALSPLGEEYQAAARAGLASRWTDVYETPGKTTGAYSWWVPGAHPFMLLNYQDTLSDVFTLAHEMGHSMHTYFTLRAQPYVYSTYTLFLAEVASTLNEELLAHYLLEQSDDPALRLAVVNHSLEQVRSTIYRQTMFAEFEKITHERAEAGEALTADTLSQIHYDLNVAYHGEDMAVDNEVAIEWARIPHFYRTFYVYKYATGMSAAIALARQILNDGPAAAERYLRFLSKGGSGYSIDLLREAGVDMTSPEPVNQALRLFGERIDEMESLLGL